MKTKLATGVPLLLGIFFGGIGGATPLKAAENVPSSLPALTLQANDVIAFVGGEEIVAMQEHGYLELLLTLTHPKQRLRFRNLGWEGDTVYEQRRDLNFGPWEEQLSRVGATVLICQFGQAESLEEPPALARFAAAYQALLNQFKKQTRRIVLLSPTPFESPPRPLPDLTSRNAPLADYVRAVRELATANNCVFVDGFAPLQTTMSAANANTALTREGIHLNARGHWQFAQEIIRQLGISSSSSKQHPTFGDGEGEGNSAVAPERCEQVRQAILRKNRYWFDYWRPMNWAFLKGDRIEQPSSRDHRDPNIRWFPKEMEEFLPLIQAEEDRIAKLMEGL